MANGSLRALLPAYSDIDSHMVFGIHGPDIERRWQCRALKLPGLQTLFEQALSRTHTR
jgi:hypothetical protein